MTAPEAVMAATERITMTMRELDRFKVIQAVADGVLKPWRAAQRLGLTTRQIRRLVARLREDGPGGLVSRRRSKPSNSRLDAATAERALSELLAGQGIRARLWSTSA
jgi:Winged helix-turn helix